MMSLLGSLDESLSSLKTLVIAKQHDAIAVLAYHPVKKLWTAAMITGPGPTDGVQTDDACPHAAVIALITKLTQEEVKDVQA